MLQATLTWDVPPCLCCVCQWISVAVCAGPLLTHREPLGNRTRSSRSDAFLTQVPTAKTCCGFPVFCLTSRQRWIPLKSSFLPHEFQSPFWRNIWKFPRLLANSPLNFSKGSHHVGSLLTSRPVRGKSTNPSDCQRSKLVVPRVRGAGTVSLANKDCASWTWYSQHPKISSLPNQTPLTRMKD